MEESANSINSIPTPEGWLFSSNCLCHRHFPIPLIVVDGFEKLISKYVIEFNGGNCSGEHFMKTPP